nr:MAG TPA: hypothetical protein [Caudoviricetes sp.]
MFNHSPISPALTFSQNSCHSLLSITFCASSSVLK